jgi:hypothetical protein
MDQFHKYNDFGGISVICFLKVMIYEKINNQIGLYGRSAIICSKKNGFKNTYGNICHNG